MSLNNPMRGFDVNYQPRELSAKQPHPLPVTMHLLKEGIEQLRAVEANSATANEKVILWRGMKDVQVPKKFTDKGGGAEKAPMSTTRDLKVAVQYSSSNCSVMFKLVTESFRERGADLSFLSAFPNEAETLYPPLTHLKLCGKVQEIETGGTNTFLVVPVKPSF